MPLKLGPGEPTIVRGTAVPEAPNVSVVIPTYTHTWLDECLDSIRAQTYRDCEIIVVDDGSPEPAAPARCDDLVLVRQENSRPGGARNRGATIARGEWIAFCDSDDLWRPTKLERQLAFHAEHRTCVLSTTLDTLLLPDGEGWRAVDQPARQPTGIVPYAEVFYENFVVCSASLVRREAYLASGGMAVGRWCEEVDAWLRIGLAGDVGYIAEVLCERRQHQQSWTSVTVQEGRRIADEEACYAEFLAEHPALRGQAFVRRALARIQSERGFSALAQRHWSEALHAGLRAVRLAPRERLSWSTLGRAILRRARRVPPAEDS